MVTSQVFAAIEQCDREIARCLAYLDKGGPEDIGAYVGLTDWQTEKRLIEALGQDEEKRDR